MENAARKLERKNLDMIVATDASQPGAGFNVDTNIATLLTHDGARGMSPRAVAWHRIFWMKRQRSRERGQEKA